MLKFVKNLCAFDLQIAYGGRRCDLDSKCVIFCIYCCGHVLARSGSAAEINNQQLSQFTALNLLLPGLRKKNAQACKMQKRASAADYESR